jgi:folate-binding protein YgfZ
MLWMRRPDYGVIRVTGEDAQGFLQGQLTNNVLSLAPDRAVRAAYCTPQGRAIALLTLLPQQNGLLMVLPGELLQSVMTRLRMFVMRSRVTLEEAKSEGLLICANQLPNALSRRDQVRSDQNGLTWVASSDPALVWRLLEEPGQGLTDFDANLARQWQIDAGLPEVDERSGGQYVPQMLNLDALDAISFRKGCYTGQEIVARTQHLGRIKRRLFRLEGDGSAPNSGASVEVDERGIGQVLLSASLGDRFCALAVLQLDAAQAGSPMNIGESRVETRPLPYSLPETD